MLLRRKQRIDLSLLKTFFSLEEIKKAIFKLEADKAPRPHGFPLFFFQK